MMDHDRNRTVNTSFKRWTAERRIRQQLRKQLKDGRRSLFNADYLAAVAQPDTVIDVGVGFGTAPLYAAFPHSHFILVEPLRESVPTLDYLARHYRCEVVHKAAGEQPGELDIQVDTQRPPRSSLHSRAAGAEFATVLETRRIEVTTLDQVLADSQAPAHNILLKIDTEGYELKVLQGARSVLPHCSAVIVESSIAERFSGGYRFEDLIGWMHQQGFGLYSILCVTQPRKELQPRFADLLFTPLPARA